MKELDISKTLNNKIQEILEEGSSESQELKNYKDVLKNIKKKLGSRKPPHKPNKPSGFMNNIMVESLTEKMTRSKILHEKIQKGPGFIKLGVLNFETLLENTFKKYAHILPQESLIWTSKNQVKLQNGQFFHAIKKSFIFDDIEILITYLKKIKTYLKCSQNSGFLKLIAISMCLLEPCELKSCFLFEPIKETLEDYLLRNPI